MTEQSGLFWKETPGKVRKGKEAEEYTALHCSPEQTGERLVETVTAWLAHALEQLPAEWQRFRIDFERPDWIDPGTPEHALHELQRLTAQLPRAIPEKPPLEREQRRAVEVLMAARDTVEAVQGLAPARALVLIDNALNLGIAAARAHVEPWEVRVEIRLAGNQRGGQRTGELKQEQAQERINRARSIWEGLDKPERNRAGIVAARMGVPADTVRRWRRDGWQLPRKADTS